MRPVEGCSSGALTVAVFQLLPYELEADVLVDPPQQVGFRNLIFQAEIIERRGLLILMGPTRALVDEV
jgi:hypothetical protein